MEASANAESKSQENTKQEIQVEDFFLNEQNNNPSENPQTDIETGQKEKAHEEAGNDTQKEGKIDNQAEETQNAEAAKETADDLFKGPEVKYSKIPEFDEDNRKNTKAGKGSKKAAGNGAKAKSAKVIQDEEENKTNSEENKEFAENNENQFELVLDEAENESKPANKNGKKNLTKKSEKNPKKEKAVKPIRQALAGENADCVVDLEEIKKKQKIENADIILCLIEICTNSDRYGLTNSNKSRLFWDELFKKDEIAKVFSNFKSETLRKYWRLINELNKTDKVVETVRKYEDQINKENVKLLTIINAICDSIKGKHKSLETYFATVGSTQAKKSSSNPKKNLTKKKRKRAEGEDESSDSLINDLIVINKNIEKSKKEHLEGEEPEESAAEPIDEYYEGEEEEEEYDDLESDDEPFQLNNIDMSKDRVKANKRRLTRTQIAAINKVIKPSEREKRQFAALDDLLEAFAGNFTGITAEQILDVFKKNSFDLHSSYLQLVNPGIFESKCFTEPDDYIIKNLKETEYYEELLDRKGEDAVGLRHAFLKIEEDY